jgi:hypothetical protein
VTKKEESRTNLHPRNIPTISIRTNPLTAVDMFIDSGSNMKDTFASGNANADNVTAAYIAPEAPREGKISMTGREAVRAAVAEAADAVAVALEDTEICDISLGYSIRVAAMWDTKPEKRPASGDGG